MKNENASERIVLHLTVDFQTDGDFLIENPEHVLETGKPLYKGTELTFAVTRDDYKYSFTLNATGAPDPCRRAARDMLQRLICAVKTDRYYLVNDLYRFLAEPLENELWRPYEHGIKYHASMGGNYEGTMVYLSILPQENA